MSHRSLIALSVVLWLQSGAASMTGSEPATLASVQEAYVLQGDDSWTIGNALIALRVGFAPRGALAALDLSSHGAGPTAQVAPNPVVSFVAQGRRLSPGVSTLAFREARVGESAGSVRLELMFEDLVSRLRVTMVYACATDSPGIETWAVVEALDPAGSISLSDIGIWQMTLPASEVGWITGLQATAADGGRFTRRRMDLGPGAELVLGSDRRSSESAVPAVWLKGPEAHFFGGLLWSGAWRLSLTSASGGATVRMSLGDTATTVRGGQPLETPHGFYGLAGLDDRGLSEGWQAFIRNGVRQGRPVDPRVTYNTWFSYGIHIDESTLRDQMTRVAALGVELFVVDAGWYPGGTRADDFVTGLGAWAADARRFPSGLRALGDYARSLGLKFGIWVEPEQIDLDTLNRPGLARERFLATTRGRYNTGVRNESASAAQICLADAQAREWVKARLFQFLDEVGPDYLKWDNNYWINCDRAGHGHGAEDGHLMHVKGLYEIFAALRDRYPALAIENCATGGNRLDLGLLRYTDAAWMDDVSAPSSHVRHNVEGLSAVFPSGYLLSFVMDDPSEPVHGAADMSLYFRSRMLGALGMSIRAEEFGQDDTAAMRREISLYKRTRPILRDAVPMLLTDQVPARGSDAWDAMQFVSASTGNVVLHAFGGGLRSDSTTLRPQALDPEGLYRIFYGRMTPPMDITGAAAMGDGLEILSSPESAAHLLFFFKR